MNIPHRRILFAIGVKERSIVDELGHAVVCGIKTTRLILIAGFSIIIHYRFSSIIEVRLIIVSLRDR